MELSKLQDHFEKVKAKHETNRNLIQLEVHSLKINTHRYVIFLIVSAFIVGVTFYCWYSKKKGKLNTSNNNTTINLELKSLRDEKI